ncbi:MAG: hypothetical protein HUU20_14590 [Pirellulales bacterium]|nr:hypothetical protein [Pirellulales bacterium]
MDANPHIDPQPWPEDPAASRLIVCERTGGWAVALRRETPLKPLRVYETRSLVDCWQMLARFPSSFVVAELERGNVDSLLDRLCGLERQYPRARVAVVAEPSLADYEWLLREAGAVHFLTSRRGAGRLALVARRHLAQAPEPRRSIADRIWAGLPWGST